MKEPQYGAEGEAVSFSLESNPFEDRALIPADSYRVTLETWPDHEDDATNRYYPIVFGSPGVYKLNDGTGATVAGSPGYGIGTVDTGSGPMYSVLIAGHEVEATQITLYNPVTGFSSVTPVVTTTDGLGQIVSIAQPVTLIGTEQLWVIWETFVGSAIGSGGLINDHYTGIRTGAGEVLSYFFRLSTIEQDRGRWRAIEDYLNQRFKFSGYLDKQCSPWDFIKDNFLPLLPLGVIAASDGLAPVLWRREG